MKESRCITLNTTKIHVISDHIIKPQDSRTEYDESNSYESYTESDSKNINARGDTNEKTATITRETEEAVEEETKYEHPAPG